MHHRFWDFGFMSFHGFGSIFMILFWVLLIVLVVSLLREMFGGSSSNATSKDALDFLNERYAKGEIDKADYDRMRHDIQQ